MINNKLIILDRDGVINHDSDDYIKSVKEWLPIEGSLEAISQLNKAGYGVAIATNQSGIGRGYYRVATLQAMHHKMQQLLLPFEGHIDHIEFCPHVPDDNCECRKPKAGMLHNIAQRFSVNTEDMLMVGDSVSDYYAATHAGVEFVLVKTGKGERTLATGQLPKEIAIYINLADCVEHYLKLAKRIINF